MGDGGQSGWALRNSDDRRQVSSEQLALFETWGLLRRDASGDYEAGSAERLQVILDAADEARLLSRRVLRIYGTIPGFPVPAARIRQAMIELIPVMARPLRKLTTIAKVRMVMGGRDVSEVRPARLPSAAEQRALVEAYTAAEVDRLRGSWFYQATTVLPAYADGAGIDLSDIPIEERVVLIAILDRAQLQRGGAPPATLL